MHPMERIIQESKRNPLKIVLGTDARMLKAAGSSRRKNRACDPAGHQAAIEQTAATKSPLKASAWMWKNIRRKMNGQEYWRSGGKIKE